MSYPPYHPQEIKTALSTWPQGTANHWKYF
ncbi:hypothetical protein ID866_10757 [Astraeus odoratus]|nr:hypothetical protein ID866_10757 [Astraeus odoratus]